MLPFTDPIPHRRMAPHERLKLEKALSLTRFGGALTMDPATTAFTGMTLDERDEEQEVIDAIKSCPVHYADSVTHDNRSGIRKQFDDIATRCTTLLREISDEGRILCPVDIAAVQELIVEELGKLYFNGLPEEDRPCA